MLHPKTWIERFAYDKKDFAHNPQWVLYDHAPRKWYDFDAIPLPFSPTLYLIPLFGQTSGHCGVAIKDGDGWLFHAADALLVGVEFNITPGWLNRMVIGPHVSRLKAFGVEHPEVRMLAGHYWSTFFLEKEKVSDHR